VKKPQGRFRAPIDPEALTFSTSLPVDRHLYEEDIAGSIAHVTMLAGRKILPSASVRRIVAALRAIRTEIATGAFVPDGKPRGRNRMAADDIHMAIEQRLREKIGPIAGIVHTARSRNDQVALDERLYLKHTVADVHQAIGDLQRSLVNVARQYADVVMPGYTHMQRAQPIFLAHHLLAYVEMLQRDADRFTGMMPRIARSPLGAAALAGTSFPIDRKRVAHLLDLEGIVENSIDAVSDRDGLIEFTAACAIVMMHLSRLGEELVLWSSQEWRFAFIGDAFTTGSSIMPQKKNPDMAELVRGKTGRVYGDLVTLLTLMKGLPLAYNRDMQEDKEPLFDAADTTLASLRIMARMMATVHFDRNRFEAELDGDPLLATEIADYLVRRGMPFRAAHGIAGQIVLDRTDARCTLAGMTLKDFKSYAKEFESGVLTLLSPRTSLKAKRSAGSTSPREVRAAIQRWHRRLSLRSRRH
jgi:argininosuccinate lyase